MLRKICTVFAVHIQHLWQKQMWDYQLPLLTDNKDNHYNWIRPACTSSGKSERRPTFIHMAQEQTVLEIRNFAEELSQWQVGSSNNFQLQIQCIHVYRSYLYLQCSFPCFTSFVLGFINFVWVFCVCVFFFFFFFFFFLNTVT